jgi:predicted permease
MRTLTSLRTLLDFLLRRSRVEREMEEELQIHLRNRTNDLERQGFTRAEAERQARIEFGGYQRYKEDCREVLGTRLVQELVADVRYGVRRWLRSPGFTTVAVLTLGLGISVNTTMFSVISATLLRKPPADSPNRLCAISSSDRVEGYDLGDVSAPDFESWRARNTVFEQMAAVESGRSFTLTGNGEPEAVDGDLVTPSYFSVIGVLPVQGRAFLPSEGQAGSDHVVILSYSFWRERYGSSRGAIGKILDIDHQPYTIVGVMPKGADEPMPWYPPRLWVPLVFSAKDLSAAGRGERDLNMVLGRLKPGATIGQARAEMQSIGDQLAKEYPSADKDEGVSVLTLQEYLIRKPHIRTALMILMAMVGLVLLAACANIAGLMLAQGAARGHELAVRSAVGASRARLARQMLVESVLLGTAGGAAGLILSVWGIKLLRAGFSFNFYGAEQARNFGLDDRTLFFTIIASLLSAVLFGLLPAFRASKISPSDALSEGGRTGSGGFARARLRGILVASEVALAVALLAGAGVMARMVRAELSVSTGFNPHDLLRAEINLKSRKYEKTAAQAAFFQQAALKLESLPGVEATSATTGTPLEGYWSRTFDIVGQPPLPKSKRPSAQDFFVGPGYFRTMQIPFIKGREFLDSDDARSPMVAIVNREFVRRFFPKGDAIGRSVELDGTPQKPAQIVGIVGDVLPFYGQFGEQPQIYECYLQVPSAQMGVVLRSRVPPAALGPMMRRAIWTVNKDQPFGRIQTMKEVAAGSEGGDRLMVALMAIFAGLALLLAAVGIYGVIAYSVTQRTREIGIRVALGARKKDVLGLVLRQGGLLIGVGCAVGFLLALPLPRLFANLFEGFPLQGPLVAITVALIVAIVSVLATFIPARRATKVDPMVAVSMRQRSVESPASTSTHNTRTPTTADHESRTSFSDQCLVARGGLCVRRTANPRPENAARLRQVLNRKRHAGKRKMAISRPAGSIAALTHDHESVCVGERELLILVPLY